MEMVISKTTGAFMVYFIYHDKIIKHANRPFHGIEEMNKTLIRNWNRKVGANDDVYIVGDVAMKGAAYATDMLKQETKPRKGFETSWDFLKVAGV